MRRGGREERGVFLSGDPEGLGRGDAEQAGDVQILRAAGQEHRVAVIQELAEAEAGGIDRGLGDGSASGGTCGGRDSAHLTEAGEGDLLHLWLRAIARRQQVARDGYDVMHALGEEGVIIAKGVGGNLAGAGHDTGLHEFLVLLEEEVGGEHADAAVDEFL